MTVLYAGQSSLCGEVEKVHKAGLPSGKATSGPRSGVHFQKLYYCLPVALSGANPDHKVIQNSHIDGRCLSGRQSVLPVQEEAPGRGEGTTHGTVVGSAETSEAFLCQDRRTDTVVLGHQRQTAQTQVSALFALWSP